MRVVCVSCVRVECAHVRVVCVSCVRVHVWCVRGACVVRAWCVLCVARTSAGACWCVYVRELCVHCAIISVIV